MIDAKWPVRAERAESQVAILKRLLANLVDEPGMTLSRVEAREGLANLDRAADRLLAELKALRTLSAAVEHAVELGYFEEGGSTVGWIQEALREVRNLNQGGVKT